MRSNRSRRTSNGGFAGSGGAGVEMPVNHACESERRRGDARQVIDRRDEHPLQVSVGRPVAKFGHPRRNTGKRFADPSVNSHVLEFEMSVATLAITAARQR